MITELYKKKKDELINICRKNKIEYRERETKRELAEKIYRQKGGRYYRCQKGTEVDFVESIENPSNGEGRYRDPAWICNETGLTNKNNPRRPGCSYGLKPDMRCVPCDGNKNGKKPNVCRACAPGDNIYYCN